MKNLFILLSGLFLLGLQAGCSNGDVSQNPPMLANLENPAAPEPGSDQQSPEAAVPVSDPVPEPLPETEPMTPDSVPPSESACQPSDEELVMLELVNAARAEPRQCGNESFAAALTLGWNCDLRTAAESHTRDMVDNNFFGHTGSDGLNVGDRVTATGYQWRTVGENIAAGYSTEELVMQGWLDSPGHCANIMNPAFQEFGSAVILTHTAVYPSYWTQVFATSQ